VDYNCRNADVIRNRFVQNVAGSLEEHEARVVITARLDRLAFGHVGDCKPAGAGISELRVDHGPGYRIYFKRRGDQLILLLCGGDKDTQEKDIKRAKQLAKEWSEENG
jgi:putative addiction module killer protein